MSLRERVRLLRKELCEEVIAELDRLEGELRFIAEMEPGSRGAYQKFEKARMIAAKAIKEHPLNG